ncbi:MAG TPA: O-antigen ligase family protein [Candidatus Obscuribacterales bacterium]
MTASPISIVALSTLDEKWRSTLSGSLLYRIVGAPIAALSRMARNTSENTGRLGTFLQQCAFLMTFVLCGLLWLPQFAADKEGLAIIALGALAVWLFGKFLGGAEERRSSAVDALVLLYLALNIVAAAASHYFVPSLKGVAKVIVYVSSYFLFTSIATTPRRRLLLLCALVAGGFAASLYGLYQYKIGVEPLATWEDPTVDTKTTRIYSTLGNPNLLAGYLLPLIPIAACLNFVVVALRRYFFLLITMPVTGAILGACVLTGSRGGYVGMAAVFAALGAIVAGWIWIKAPKLRPLIIVALIAAPILLSTAINFVPQVEQRISSIFVGREHSSNSFRMNVWLASLNMFKDNWWFGIGPGNQAFRLAYGLYMKSGFDALGTYCVPLEVAVETGITGLACFALLVAACLGRAHLIFWSKDAGWERWIALAAATALVGLMAHGLVDTVFFRPQVQFIFWLVAALTLFKPPAPIHESSSVSAPPPGVSHPPRV